MCDEPVGCRAAVDRISAPSVFDLKSHHPRAAVVQRYLDHGAPLENIFRTDLGDNEGGAEWAHGATNSPDSKGDDDIEIIIQPTGEVAVRYAQ